MGGHMRTSITRAATAFLVCVSLSSPAYAYLDPATGSILVQAVIGVVASWMLYSKMFAAKAKSYVVRLFQGDTSKSGK